MSSVLTLREGSRGSAVTVWQQNLSKLGFTTKVDGNFGKDTKAKTILFQKANGLYADGIAGPATQGKMIQILKEKFPISSGIQSIVSIIKDPPTATYTPIKTTTTQPKPSPNPSPAPSPSYSIVPEEKPKEASEDGFGGILLIGGVILGGLWAITKLDSGTKRKRR